MPPLISLGVEDSLETPLVHCPPGLQGGVEGEVVGEGATESERAAVLEDTDVSRLSPAHCSLPHCEQLLLRALHPPVPPGEVAAVQTTVL